MGNKTSNNNMGGIKQPPIPQQINPYGGGPGFYGQPGIVYHVFDTMKKKWKMKQANREDIWPENKFDSSQTYPLNEVKTPVAKLLNVEIEDINLMCNGMRVQDLQNLFINAPTQQPSNNIPDDEVKINISQITEVDVKIGFNIKYFDRDNCANDILYNKNFKSFKINTFRSLSTLVDIIQEEITKNAVVSSSLVLETPIYKKRYDTDKLLIGYIHDLKLNSDIVDDIIALIKRFGFAKRKIDIWKSVKDQNKKCEIAPDSTLILYKNHNAKYVNYSDIPKDEAFTVFIQQKMEHDYGAMHHFIQQPQLTLQNVDINSDDENDIDDESVESMDSSLQQPTITLDDNNAVMNLNMNHNANMVMGLMNQPITQQETKLVISASETVEDVNKRINEELNIHGVLKFNDIVLTSRPYVKIIDFGVKDGSTLIMKHVILMGS